MKKIIIGFVVLTLSCLGCTQGKKSTSSGTEQADASQLTILWAKWPPADYLQQLTADFTAETGIKVEISQESWGEWQEIFFGEMARKGQSYDLAIGDSQWLGRASTDGHYMDLTQWITDHGVARTMTAASMTGYGEYPKGSGRYWAVPCEGDAMGFAYRKDLFEDPQEQAAFKSRFGYELKIPETMTQLRDIAAFFHRPQSGFYGVHMWVEPDYDGLTMALESFIWAWGGDLGDQRTYKVKGILDTEASIQALEFYRQLTKFDNPAWERYYLDSLRNSNQPLIDGKAVMCLGYFAIMPDLINKKINPKYWDKVGFFATPAGPRARVTSLGGQGISVVSYSQNKEAAFKFLEWWVREDVQKKWGMHGGLTCNRNVLDSSEFLDRSPINRPFRESMSMVRDFWAVPEYADLLAICQRQWYRYVVKNEISARESIDRVAQGWYEVFKQAGYYDRKKQDPGR